MKNLRLIMLTVIIMMLLSGCGKNDKAVSKSIEQIHEEKGVPVAVEEISTQKFSRFLSYSGRLKGIRQSTEQSLVSGKIESIAFKEGDFVTKGSVVIDFPENLTGANFQAAKANNEIMEITYNRLKNLYDEGAISKQELDQSKAQYLAASSQFEAVTRMLRIESPISGYLTSVYVQVSDHIDPGDLLFTVSSLKKLKSVINVSEKEIGFFKKGLKAKAVWENLEYNGIVTSMSYAMNERTGAFEVELEFDNPNDYKKFNVIAAIEIEVYHKEDVFVISKKYIQSDSRGNYVFIAKGDKAEKRYLELGESSLISFEVLSGLQEDELLITEGRNLLDDGSKILIK